MFNLIDDNDYFFNRNGYLIYKYQFQVKTMIKKPETLVDLLDRNSINYKLMMKIHNPTTGKRRY